MEIRSVTCCSYPNVNELENFTFNDNELNLTAISQTRGGDGEKLLFLSFILKYWSLSRTLGIWTFC